MTGVPTDPPSDRVTRILVATEFRWLYVGTVIFTVLLGAGFLFLGSDVFTSYLEWRGTPERASQLLTQSLTTGALGVFFLLVSLALYLTRRYLLRLRDQAAHTLENIRKIELRKLGEDDFEQYDEVRRLFEEKAQADFERNLASSIKIEDLVLRDVLLFPRADWSLQPGVNVLLGRNGYGKSLLLRALAGALQRDEEATESFFPTGAMKGGEPVIELRLRRDGGPAKVRRSPVRFVESIGKVPLLAIPDSRLLDRSQLTVAPPTPDTDAGTDLAVDGATHFLHHHPYGPVLQGLLYEIALDYWEHGRSFDLPVFEFIRHCTSRLTGSDFEFRSIQRRGRTGFEIKVYTEGNTETIPIQYASQGTLSVLAIFGLIRSFLRSLPGSADDELVEPGSGIVVIDEADAHLHPAWQQKVPTLLRDLFPNVQFVLTAHSPLFVAGCWPREAAVLRRYGSEDAAGFRIEQLERSFVGATSAELFQEIFEIEELDETFLEYSAKASLRDRYTQRIAQLTDRREESELSEDERRELRKLVEENRRIHHAVEKKRKRAQEENPEVRIAELEAHVLELEARLGERGSGRKS